MNRMGAPNYSRWQCGAHIQLSLIAPMVSSARHCRIDSSRLVGIQCNRFLVVVAMCRQMKFSPRDDHQANKVADQEIRCSRFNGNENIFPCRPAGASCGSSSLCHAVKSLVSAGNACGSMNRRNTFLAIAAGPKKNKIGHTL